MNASQINVQYKDAISWYEFAKQYLKIMDNPNDMVTEDPALTFGLSMENNIEAFLKNREYDLYKLPIVYLNGKVYMKEGTQFEEVDLMTTYRRICREYMEQLDSSFHDEICDNLEIDIEHEARKMMSLFEWKLTLW